MAYSRTNNATQASIDRGAGPFASGTFKHVWLGTYTAGARAGQPCVAKEFKSGSGSGSGSGYHEDAYFAEELRVVARAQAVIDRWHATTTTTSGRILLNTPEIWFYPATGHQALVEPFIANFEKFNSNTGWAAHTGSNDAAWSDAMQALSHFSYHNSGGQLLLCDLQGGSYSDGYILSDPVIMSQQQNCGPADLGPDGIRSFFARHRCGRFCNRQWSRPRATATTLPMRQGTTMVRLPTRPGRMPLSALAEEW